MKGTNPVQESKQQALVLFESAVDEYSNERESMPLYRLQLEFMLSALANESGRVLDIGCAAGSEIQSLRSKNCTVIGIDFSPLMLERAQSRFAGQPEVMLCQADAERLPFASQSIDHVVCLGVFEYLPNYPVALSEIHRILRKGGVVVIAVPTLMSLFLIGQRLASATIGPLWRAAKRALKPKGPTRPPTPPHHRNLCVPWRFRRLLRKHGFIPERSEYSAFTIYPLDRYPSLNIRVATILQPLCSVPLLRSLASVYMVAARRT
jgi:SAM-dependent methyltransferase